MSPDMKGNQCTYKKIMFSIRVHYYRIIIDMTIYFKIDCKASIYELADDDIEGQCQRHIIGKPD